MNPASSSRYLVRLFDHDVYDIVVEAVSAAAAIKKAKRIYHLNGQALEEGNDVAGLWKAEPLVQEVRS